MPELPEVETIVRGLNRKIRGRTIVGFWTDWPKTIKGLPPRSLERQIKNKKILKVERIGKNIIFHLDTREIILVHQKMTGHLMVGRWDLGADKRPKALSPGALQEKENQFIHNIFYLKEGDMVGFSDMRKFGRIYFGDRDNVFNLAGITSLGPDALGDKLTPSVFGGLIKAKKSPIKATLLNQSVIAGIGNIYADEILWRAKINPRTLSNALSERAVQKLFLFMKIILKEAVELRGTSVGDYRDSAGKKGNYGKNLMVYGRAGKPCRKCGEKIEKTKINQRSSHFCPQCQKG